MKQSHIFIVGTICMMIGVLAFANYDIKATNNKKQLTGNKVTLVSPQPSFALKTSPLVVRTKNTNVLLPKTTPSAPNNLIDCKFRSGTLKLKSSECAQMVDCQLYSDKWIPASKQKCLDIQAELASAVLKYNQTRNTEYLQSLINNYSKSITYTNPSTAFRYEDPVVNIAQKEEPETFTILRQREEPEEITILGQSEYYTKYGNTLYGNNGDTYTKYGNITYGNDGSSYTQYGNTVYDNEGGTYQKFGNKIYGNDGTTYTQYGNTTYGNDGSTTTQFGNTIYTNP